MALLRIGEIARQAGVSPATVRLYERKGLLPASVRYSSGYRGFPEDTVARMKLIQCALAVGFTINELARILRRRDSGGAPCHDVQSLAREKLAELTRRKKELDRLCRLLKSTLRHWETALAKTPRGRRADLLESLATGSAWLAGMKSPLLHSRLNKIKRNAQ
ncbi:MAG TPA: MerR family transcriptional regulator [Candidatus Limnocylindria bacterium]|nr:MerR family transcriptional regulator [Candidatus Limnocylindria bacterium]